MLRIINVYLHGENAGAHLDTLIDQPLDPTVPVVIAGDFNLQHPMWGLTAHASTPKTRGSEHLVEWIISNDLNVLNNLDSPTRRGRHRQRDTIIDLTIGNQIVREMNWVSNWEATEQHALGSDHNCITWGICPTRNDDYSQPDYSYRYDIDASHKKEWIAAFEAALATLPFPEDFETKEDVEGGARAFLEAMHIATTRSMKKVKTNAKAPRAPWWNERCSEAVHNISLCTRGGKELEALRGALRAAIRGARRDFFAKVLAEINTSDLFTVTKWYQGRRSTKIPPLWSNGHLTVDPQEQAELFRSAFFPDTIPEVDCVDPMGVPEHNRRPHTKITEHEIAAALNNSSNTSAPGAHGSNYRVLKWAFEQCPSRLVRLYNGCLDLGFHPRCLKSAVVAVIPKPNKPDMSDPRAYRPISLLETLSKCLEKVVTSRLLFEVGRFNLIPFTQFGGRDNTSCVDAGLALTHDIQTAWSIGKQASLLTLDVKGYFNNVNHSRLIYTVRRLGFSNEICGWLQSYLSERSVRIRIDGHLCEPLALQPVGIPQGSPLSPILSSIYSLPLLYLFEHDPSISVRAYVDDFSILVSGSSFITNRDELAEAASQANQCLRRLGLEFELDKCDVIHFARAKKDLGSNPNVWLEKPDGGAHIVRAAQSIRWLGFYLDRRLNFQDHVRKMAIKGLSVIAGLRLLANTIRGLSISHARILFKTCVLPILTYGSPVWYRDKGCKTLIKPLVKAQNVGLRWVLGAFRTSPVAAMEQAASIPPLTLHLHRLSLNASTRLRRLPTRSEVAKRLPAAWDTHDPNIPAPKPTGPRQLPRTSIHSLASLSHPEAEHTNPYLAAPWDDPVGSRTSIRCPHHTDNSDVRNAYIRNAIAELAEESINGTLTCFTDGSMRTINQRRSTGAGFSIHQAGKEVSAGRAGLGRKAEVYDGEMLALALSARRAVEAALQSNTRHISFNSDNIAAVQTICSLAPHAAQYCSRIFREQVDRFLAADPSNHITIRWVPGHKGIQGNERADKLANEACEIEARPVFKRTITWAKAHATRTISRRWHSQWATTQQSLHTKATMVENPSLRPRRFHRDPGTPRLLHSRIFQAMLGHCSVGEYFARFVPSKDPACPCGEADPQTIRHALLDCPLHDEARRHLRSAFKPPDITRIFGTDTGLKALAGFLKDSSAFGYY